MTAPGPAGGAVPIDGALARDVLASAVRAPSVHNTQPWRFRVSRGGIELRPDYRRWLRVVDPEARELAISCGAALYTLRLALREHGLDPVVSFAGTGRRWVARVGAQRGGPASGAERRMLEAALLRHTHRGSFADPQLPEPLRRELVALVGSMGGELRPVDNPSGRRVRELVRAGEARQAATPGYRAEVLRWARTPGDRNRDGLPATSYPASDDRGEAVIRDFDLGRRAGSGEAPGGAGGPRLALLTPGDAPADWVSAGEALQAVLLRAAADWVFARLYTQPLEVPELREQVRRMLGGAAYPQVLLELGVCHRAGTTPRRPVAEVLTDAG